VDLAIRAAAGVLVGAIGYRLLAVGHSVQGAAHSP
jgi:hypothetical protein